MMNLLRTGPARRSSRLVPAYFARDATTVAHYSTAFRASHVARAEEVDPTPDKGRAGSEQSMPGADVSTLSFERSTDADCNLNCMKGDDIANSKGAYDSGTTRPDESGKQMEQEVCIRLFDRAQCCSMPVHDFMLITPCWAELRYQHEQIGSI